MGRGVSVPSDAETVAYIDISELEKDYEYDEIILDIMEQLKDKMPSLQETNEWLGREDKVILENALAYIGVSYYCGLMSLWIVPKYQYEQLAYNWISKIAHHVTKLGDLIKQGTMSNGVSIFERRQEE